MVSREVVFPNIRATDLTDHKELGSGSFGRVQTCLYKPLGVVTVKYAFSKKDRDQEDLKHEYEYLIKYGTSHPNIVKAYGLIEDSFDGRGLVMEYISGGTLDALILRKDIAYRIDHIVSWMAQLASAVAHMHTHQVIHRDLKPINMLLDPSHTHLKLCDFGFTRVVDESMSIRTGSWFWMAPEVMETVSYTTKCDIFSLGIVLWQLVAREKPYRELNQISEIEYIQTVGKDGRRPRDLGCTSELSILMKWCWHPDPAFRPTAESIRDNFTEMCKIYTEGLVPPMVLVDDSILRPPTGTFDGMQYLTDANQNDEESFLMKSRRRDDLLNTLIGAQPRVVIQRPQNSAALDRPSLSNAVPFTHTLSSDEESFEDLPLPEPPSEAVKYPEEPASHLIDHTNQYHLARERMQSSSSNNSPPALPTTMPPDDIDDSEYHIRTQQEDIILVQRPHDEFEIVYQKPSDAPINTNTELLKEKLERPAPIQVTHSKTSMESKSPTPKHKYLSLITSPGVMIQVSGSLTPETLQEKESQDVHEEHSSNDNDHISPISSKDVAPLSSYLAKFSDGEAIARVLNENTEAEPAELKKPANADMADRHLESPKARKQLITELEEVKPKPTKHLQGKILRFQNNAEYQPQRDAKNMHDKSDSVYIRSVRLNRSEHCTVHERKAFFDKLGPFMPKK